MKTTITALALLCGLLAFTWAKSQEGVPGEPSACGMVQRALADSQRIKVGMTRTQLEKYFVADGGVQFPNNWRYVYPKCEYLKLEVEFTAGPTRGQALSSPDDTVTRVSKLFVDYPVKD